MKNIRVNFNEISIRGTKKFYINDKIVTRTKKFYQTLNPFNKNKYGNPKTKEEILEALIIERDLWFNETKNVSINRHYS